MKQSVLERQIQWGDLDALGIVFYPRYYEWIDAAGHRFFDRIGLNLARLWKDEKVLFGLVETGCRYHRPGRYMQQVRIVTGIARLDKKTLTLAHRIEDAADGALLVEGRERRICMDVSDSENIRAAAIPEKILAVLADAGSHESGDWNESLPSFGK